MKCTNKEQETCGVEKRGCEGCCYEELDKIKELEKEVEEKTVILMAGAEKVKLLEKEIEELKNDNFMLLARGDIDTYMKLKKDYIPKQKIKDRMYAYWDYEDMTSEEKDEFDKFIQELLEESEE